MILEKRQKDILLKIVEEYIKSAQPISSKFLKEKYKFPLSPATIRLEMHQLTEKGLLSQPHTSAGRVPTEKAYRVFVNEIIEEGVKELEIGKYLNEDFENEIIFAQFLAKKLSELSKALISIYFEKSGLFFETGWQEVLKEPEFKNKDFLLSFTNFSRKLEIVIEKLKLNSEIKIFIGKEIPIKEGRNFSLILLKSGLPEAGKAVISLSGPQRMNYNKNIGLFAGLRKYFKSL